MPIALKRAYDAPAVEDGYRVLVDRLWPRGVSRTDAALDLWLKEAAPSDTLRRWYHANPAEWIEFRRRYLAELEHHREALQDLAERATHEPVTLVYSSRERERNNAVVLREYLATIGPGR